MWRNLVARRLWEPKGAGSNPAIPICPCDVIGKHRLLKISVLQVRGLSGVLGIQPISAICSRGGTADALGRESSFLQVQILSGASNF